jgi:hypothetical protein
MAFMTVAAHLATFLHNLLRSQGLQLTFSPFTRNPGRMTRRPFAFHAHKAAPMRHCRA